MAFQILTHQKIENHNFNVGVCRGAGIFLFTTEKQSWVTCPCFKAKNMSLNVWHYTIIWFLYLIIEETTILRVFQISYCSIVTKSTQLNVKSLYVCWHLELRTLSNTVLKLMFRKQHSDVCICIFFQQTAIEH